MSKESSRTQQIKQYLKRLSNGEDLEAVRADFVKDFSEVEAMEIMQAEQDLINEGIPIEEVQKLCDVHSALFHGATREERIVNAEKEVAASIKRAETKEQMDKNAIAAKLEKIPGHPLKLFHDENTELDALLKKAKEDLTTEEDVLTALLPVITHYAKKGDLLYPHLKENYGVTGPSNVMWTVDDEIRDELKKLVREENHDEKWQKRAEDVLKRMEEMIYKEENILFPAAALMFTEDDWKQLYQDQKDYDTCFGLESEVWDEAESAAPEEETVIAEEIKLPGGSLKPEELQAIMKTLPIEVTFIDADNINKYFNEGPKIFKRPSIAIGHDVLSCHPPKVAKAVENIIEDFKSGKRDQITLWNDKRGKLVQITYMAVRDDDGKFLGTMELVQDMEDIKKHFEK